MKVLLGTLVLFPLSWTQWIYLNIAKGYKNLGTNENARYWLVKHHPGGLICAVRFFLVSSIHKRILETHKKESFEHTHTHTHITDTCTSYSLIFCVCYEYYGYSWLFRNSQCGRLFERFTVRLFRRPLLSGSFQLYDHRSRCCTQQCKTTTGTSRKDRYYSSM